MMEKKNIVITGSNRGIGAEILKICAENGYNIWACARRKDLNWENSLKIIEKKNDCWIHPLYFDMRCEDEIKSAFKTIFDTKMNIDALVNNAGITTYNQPFTMISINQIEEIYKVNVVSLMYLSQLCLKRMIRQKQGNIINISSICGQDVLPSNTIYGSSKAAVISFTRNLASEVGKYGIRVNTVAPGPTYTDIIEPVRDYFENKYKDGIALRRLAEAKDVANAVKYLLSNESDYITGQILRVDGGKF